MVKSKQEIITQDIALKIKHQLYKPGDYLPSENQLAELYGAARNTVRKSLGDLTDLGLIQKIKGKGSLVLDSSRYAFPVSGITSFKELNETLGMKAKTEVLRLEEIEQLPANIKVEQVDADKFIFLERLRLINDQPKVLDRDYLLSPPVNFLPIEEAQNSIYAYLEDKLGFVISYATKEITVRKVDDYIASKLKLEADRRAVLVSSKTYLEDTRLFEITESYHHPDDFSFFDFARRRKI